MYEFLKKLFKRKQEHFPGLLLDEASLRGLPKLDEIVADVAPVIWKPLDLAKIPKYPVYSQNGSGSCVAMSMALIGSILYYIRRGVMIKFSPKWIYKQRSNASIGMIGTESFKIAAKGLLLEELMPSQDLTEEQMNASKMQPEYYEVAKAFAIEDTFVELPLGDIETVASVMQVTGKPVMVWFEFLYEEWLSIPIIRVILGNFLRHSVVAIDYGVYESEKAIVIQESWGFNSTNFGVIRIIKASFFRSRNIFAAYPRRFKFEVSANMPIYDGTIISVQKCLQTLGYFPLGVSFIENLGPLTRSAIKKFQEASGLMVDGTLNEATRSLLTKRFN